ncbi:hypothetical protein NDU88_005245 [Pleurodeles waltl]|uniref:Uncharacterized protein n=1 Tax=Pleurodeles waltl TaxID=8319 RepID=A0AAV7RLT2_PLEWA|nr:hypothetical protein NDU88_005245 [Pleurodeles waltl]
MWTLHQRRTADGIGSRPGAWNCTCRHISGKKGGKKGQMGPGVPRSDPEAPGSDQEAEIRVVRHCQKFLVPIFSMAQACLGHDSGLSS